MTRAFVVIADNNDVPLSAGPRNLVNLFFKVLTLLHTDFRVARLFTTPRLEMHANNPKVEFTRFEPRSNGIPEAVFFAIVSEVEIGPHIRFLSGAVLECHFLGVPGEDYKL